MCCVSWNLTIVGDRTRRRGSDARSDGEWRGGVKRWVTVWVTWREWRWGTSEQVPHRREVAVARVLGRLRRCRRQRSAGHDDFSASLTLTLTLEWVTFLDVGFLSVTRHHLPSPTMTHRHSPLLTYLLTYLITYLLIHLLTFLLTH